MASSPVDGYFGTPSSPLSDAGDGTEAVKNDEHADENQIHWQGFSQYVAGFVEEDTTPPGATNKRRKQAGLDHLPLQTSPMEPSHRPLMAFKAMVDGIASECNSVIKLKGRLDDQINDAVLRLQNKQPALARAHGNSLNRVALGARPRGCHVGLLVSKFSEYFNVILSTQCDAPFQQLQQFFSMLHRFPKSKRVLSQQGDKCGTSWTNRSKSVVCSKITSLFFGSQTWQVHESSSMGFTFGPRVAINLAEVVGTGLRPLFCTWIGFDLAKVVGTGLRPLFCTWLGLMNDAYEQEC